MTEAFQIAHLDPFKFKSHEGSSQPPALQCKECASPSKSLRFPAIIVSHVASIVPTIPHSLTAFTSGRSSGLESDRSTRGTESSRNPYSTTASACLRAGSDLGSALGTASCVRHLEFLISLCSWAEGLYCRELYGAVGRVLAAFQEAC